MSALVGPFDRKWQSRDQKWPWPEVGSAHARLFPRAFFFKAAMPLLKKGAKTYLFVEAQIVADDDTALDAGADVGPVNLWMHSLFSDQY